jgi:hypothetical protein
LLSDFAELLGFFYFEDFPILVVSALGASAMRHFLLVTVGALGTRMRRKEVVRTPNR